MCSLVISLLMDMTVILCYYSVFIIQPAPTFTIIWFTLCCKLYVWCSLFIRACMLCAVLYQGKRALGCKLYQGKHALCCKLYVWCFLFIRTSMLCAVSFMCGVPSLSGQACFVL